MVAPSLLTQELVTRPREPGHDTPVHRRRRPGRLLRRRSAAPDAAGVDVAFTIRRASAVDAAALRDLARLDSRRPLDGPALVAELDGRLVAALDLRSHRAVADPFQPSGHAVELLRLRAAQLTRADAFAADVAMPGLPAAPRWVPGSPHH